MSKDKVHMVTYTVNIPAREEIRQTYIRAKNLDDAIERVADDLREEFGENIKLKLGVCGEPVK